MDDDEQFEADMIYLGQLATQIEALRRERRQ